MAQVGPYQGITLKQGTQYTRLFWFGTTAQTLTVNLSKAGAAFGTATGTVTEIANGWYKIVLSVADTNTLGDLAYHITAASGGPLDFQDFVSANIFSDIQLNASGRVLIANNLQQNTATNGFTFPMTNAATGVLQTGLSVTAQRSLGGAGFAPCANSVTEISTSGVYTINLAASDLNSDTSGLLFTAASANTLFIPLIPTP